MLTSPIPLRAPHAQIIRAAAIALFLLTIGLFESRAADPDRVVGGGSTVFRDGETNRIVVRLSSLGDESEVRLTIEFNPLAFRFVDVVPGSDAEGATLDVDVSLAALGRVAVALTLPEGASFPPGQRALFEVALAPLLGFAGTSHSVAFTDGMILRRVSNAQAVPLAASFVDETASINAPPVIPPVATTRIPEDTVGHRVPFTIVDPDSLESHLSVRSTYQSSALFPGGSVVGSGSGTNRALTFTPTANLSGQVAISVTASDRISSGTTPIRVEVYEVNDPPQAIADAIDGSENSALEIPLATLVANDQPGPTPETNQVLMILEIDATTAAGGTLTVSNGIVVYAPPADFHGADTFDYTIKDNGTTDGVADPLAAVGTVTINVAHVNAGPVVGAIPDQSVDEMTAITFTALATDDNDLIRFALAPGSPEGAVIDPVTGRFSWTPTEAQGPFNHELTILATDTDIVPAVSSVTFRINVTEVNVAPSSEALSAIQIQEGQLITVSVPAMDSDIPGNVLAIERISDGPGVFDPITGVFTWNTTEADGPSTHAINFRITDNGTPSLSVTNTLNITLTEVNLPPLLGDIADVVVLEGEQMAFSISASDSDLPANLLNFALIEAPPGMSLDPVTGALQWHPTEAQGPGQYTVTLAVSDDGVPAFSDSASFVVTVNETNAPPTLLEIADQTIPEGMEFQLNLMASDSDLPANVLHFSVANAPDGMSVSSSGLLTWTPAEAHGPGTFPLTISVTDNGFPALTATAAFTLTVTEANNSPVLARVSNATVIEGEPLSFAASAVDSDEPANNLTFSLINAPSGMSITPGGLVSWTPSETQGPGEYDITLKVVDDGVPAGAGSQVFRVTVLETNTAPIILTVANKSVTETRPFELALSATDADFPANTMAFTLQSAPEGMTISPGGVITWTPVETQGPGQFSVTVAVSDNGVPALGGTMQFAITVNETNAAPTLGAISSKSVAEGELLSFALSAADADRPENSLIFTLIAAPVGMSVSPSGLISWIPSEEQGPGSYTITAKVSDNGIPSKSAVETFNVTVSEANTAPQIPLLADATIAEGTALTVQIAATDADLPPNTLSHSLQNAPPGMSIDSTGLLTWTPTESQGPGDYIVTVKVSDSGTPSLSHTQQLKVTVSEANVAPTLSIANQAVAEGELLVAQVAFADADLPANTISLALSNAPSGLSINSSGRVAWTPTEAQGPAEYRVWIIATDNGAPSQSAVASFDIVVTERNTAPALVLADRTVIAGAQLSFQMSATDQDIPANAITFSKQTAPAGLTMTPNGAVSWLTLPDETPGPRLVTVTATDNGSPALSATGSFTITVLETNRAPVVSVENQIVEEGSLALFAATVTGEDVMLELLNAPAGLSMSSDGAMSWIPSETQGPGIYTVTLVARNSADPTAMSAAQFTITVTEVNAAPSVAIGNQTIQEGSTATFIAQIADADLPANALSVALSNAPVGMSVSPAGLITWTPAEEQGPGVYTIGLSVTDDASPSVSASAAFTVIVNEVNSAPSVTAVSDQTVDEGALLSVALHAVDADVPAQNVTFTFGNNPPPGASIDPITGQISWIPTEDQGPGIYTFSVIAADSGIPVASQSIDFAVTVRDVNAAPTIALPSPPSAIEGTPLQLPSIIVSDVDAGESLLRFSLRPQHGTLTFGETNGLIFLESSEPDSGFVETSFEATLRDANNALAQLTFTPAAQFSGPAALLLSVNDLGASGLGGPLTAVDTLQILVGSVNDRPTISVPGPQTLVDGSLGAFDVSIGDLDSALEALIVSVTSSNADLLPPNAISVSGTGAIRRVQIAPVMGRVGQTVLSILVHDLDGESASGLVTVNVEATVPLVTLHPIRSIRLAEGAELSLTASASGTPLLNYQWLLNGLPISGATSPSYRVAAVGASNRGAYQLRISNAAGVAVTETATVEIISAPTIVSHAQSRLAAENSTISLSVNATGTGPLRFQWFRNSYPIAGANAATLLLSNITEADQGSYHVEVGNEAGTVRSASALLSVEQRPRIISGLQSATVVEGNTASFTVEATGTPRLDYQWFLNGSPISGGTNSTLQIPVAHLTDAGNYSVLVVNSFGEVRSASASLILLDPVRVVSGPTNQSVTIGGSASFSVQASGGAPIFYQWLRNGAPLPGATSSVLTVADVQPGQAGAYSVAISNAVSSAISLPGQLRLITPPRFISEPVSQSVTVGAPVAFAADVSGTSPLVFRWSFNGSPLPDEEGTTLNLPSVNVSHQGDYTLVVSNLAGAITATANLRVHAPLIITTQPTNRLVRAGQSVELTVAASGTGPISHQWFLDGFPIPNATAASLILPSAQLANAGAYFVRLSNGAGEVTSDIAQVTVAVAPLVTRQPVSQQPITGSDVLLDAVISGTTSTIQWFRDGAPLLDATNSALLLPAISSAQSGSYHVTASNFAGVATSVAATINVRTPIQIIAQPGPAVVLAGSPHLLSVQATGSSPIAYQWRFNGSAIPGANSSTYLLANPQNSETATDSGDYSVLVQNSVGGVVSDIARVSVITPVSILLHPGSGNHRAGDDIHLSVTAQGSGPLTYQWRRNGQPLPGETSSTLLLADASTAQAGEYDVIVANALSAATSFPSTITIVLPPTVQPLPFETVVAVASSFTLQAVPFGDAPLTFQWAINGVSIDGANAASYTITNAHPTNSGAYHVIVANRGGATNSNPALVLVDAPTVNLSDSLAASITTSAATGLFRGDNFDATAEVNEEHLPGTRAGKSVWLTWQAPARGIARFRTAGSTFDTILAVYRGARGSTASMPRVAVDEDSGPWLTSDVTFNADQGETYHIAIDGFSGAEGYALLSWDLEINPLRLPQIIERPFSFVTLPGTSHEFSVSAASVDGHQLGYQWLFGTNEIPGATNDTLLLTNIGFQHVGAYHVRVENGIETSERPLPSVTFSAGLQITTDTSLVGSVPAVDDKLTFTNLAAQPLRIGTKPIHRLATVTRGYSGSQVFSTLDAVKDPSEPQHCGELGGASSWWLYTAPANGVLRVSTAGSSFDTILAVYAVGSLNFESLVSVACDNNSGPNGTSIVTFPADANKTYFVVVDGINGASGVVNLSYELADAPLIVEQPGSLMSANGLQALADTSFVTRNVNVGATVTLQVLATNNVGVSPLSYQWRVNGLAIRGATRSTYTLTNITSNRAGDYQVMVSNFAGAVESHVVRLNVNVGATIQTPPAHQTVAVGSTATFNVVAAGSGPFTYQWRFNGVNIPSATSATLSIANVQPANAGSYTVRVQNLAGVSSTTANLTVLSPPTIQEQPSGGALLAGESATLRVVAVGSGPLTYQWRFNGVNIAGATEASLSLGNVLPQQSGQYSVVVANSVQTVTSAAANLQVNVPVSLVSQPLSQFLRPGENALFSVEARGSGPITYQWLRNGVEVAGQTSPVLTVANVQTAQAGEYRAVVANSVSTVTSAVALLTVQGPPSIVQQPVGAAVVNGSSHTFTVGAAGGGTLRYQWRQDGVAIPNATSASLNLSAITASAEGAYTVSIANDAGAISSLPAQLSMINPPVINQGPVSKSLLAGSSLQLNVSASGSLPLTFQWLFNSAPIPNATAANLSIVSLQSGNGGDYQVIVANGAGSITSAVAVVKALIAPSITQPPQGGAPAAGSSAALSVTATGSGPMRYQWRKDSVPLPGATNSVLNLINVSGAQSGDYSVTVANEAGATSSPAATLTVATAPVIVQQPTSQSVAQGSSAFLGVVATGAPSLTYQWRFGGVDILNATNSAFVLQNVSSADAGSYSVRVSNPAGSILSAVAALTVDEAEVELQVTDAAFLSTGAFRLSVSGLPGVTYQILGSGDLVNWEPLATFSISDGPFQFDDTTAGQREGRFYRVVELP